MTSAKTLLAWDRAKSRLTNALANLETLPGTRTNGNMGESDYLIRRLEKIKDDVEEALLSIKGLIDD